MPPRAGSLRYGAASAANAGALHGLSPLDVAFFLLLHKHGVGHCVGSLFFSMFLYYFSQ